MNWKRGVVRLLIVLLAAGGYAAFLITGEGEGWGIARELIITWLVFLLMGLAGYCVLRLLQIIGYFLCRVLDRGKGKTKGRKINLQNEFRELALISALICSGVLFFISFAIFTKGVSPDYFTALVASFIVFVFSLVLTWLAYAIIMFIVRGFAGDRSKAVVNSEDEEGFSKVEGNQEIS